MQSVQWSESQSAPGEISMVMVERWRKHWPFWNKGLRFVVALVDGFQVCDVYQQTEVQRYKYQNKKI